MHPSSLSALPALQHRVTDGPQAAKDGWSPRRTSAVFFISPEDMQAPLEPSVLPGEELNYVPGVSPEAQMMYNASNPLALAKARQKAALAAAPGL